MIMMVRHPVISWMAGCIVGIVAVTVLFVPALLLTAHSSHPAWCASAEQAQVTSTEPPVIRHQIQAVNNALSEQSGTVGSSGWTTQNDGLLAAEELKAEMKVRCGMKSA
jgi:hypothetical protein